MEKCSEDKFTFTWILENFSMCHHPKRPFFCSPEFTLSSLPGMKWFIRVCTQSNGNEGVFLGRTDVVSENCQIEYCIEVLDCNEKVIGTVTNATKTFAAKCGWNHDLHTNCLVENSKSDILALKCTLKPVRETNELDILPPLPYKNDFYADVVLRAGGAAFRVHKAILWARWPELAKELDETVTCEKVLSVSPNVLEAIIKYIYTGRMDFNGYEFYNQLTAAAERYKLRNINTDLLIVSQKYRICFDSKKISFEWPIPNFTHLAVNTTLNYVFTVQTFNYCKWVLRFHVSEKVGNVKIFHISLCRVHDDQYRPILVRSKISSEHSGCSLNKHLFEGKENWKCAAFSRSISEDTEDVLLLECQFKFSDCKALTKCVDSSFAAAPSTGLRYLNSNLRNLYETGEFSDVNIDVGSRIFFAHKFILSSRSSVFAKMFETEMIESKNSVVEISDVDPNIIAEMLLFMYSGSLDEPLEKTATQLYSAADKYDVPTLMSKCSSFLKSNFSVKNVLSVLQLADMHSDDDLYNSALEFLSAHLLEIFSTSEWKEMFKGNFAAKLFEDVIVHNNPTK
ncbi:protein roadkill-like [Stegodyphus dumicola]|uniref:protein roadkill-like n=1 Tax=Stegodyphus dumicola TaxID=202533 RepID=UPI0015B24761|nr:protein roadkill-like [Stegodyphus dumicola]